MPYGTSFGPPIDPAYVAFRDGYLRADDDITDSSRWRWSPAHKDWFVYAREKWILDDVSVPDTAGPWIATLSSATANLYLPDVYAQVGAAYKRYQARWPALVWTWLGGGDWRVAIPRIPNPAPDNIPGPYPPLNAECVRRVNEVLEWVRRGVITSVEGQRIRRVIVEECT